MELDKNKVFKLEGKLQHYNWGGDSFLSQLLSIPNPDKKPFAEYWMGAHEQSSAELLVGSNRIALDEYIRRFPDQTIGKRVRKKFGRLPFLLKVLDVKDMLSIQVHPSKEHAEKEFEDENRRGIPLRAAHRNYKDDNHKPELMYALSDFWLLHGFKSPELLSATLERVPELNFLLPVFEEGEYKLLYWTVMEMEQRRVNEILEPLLQRIIPAYQSGQLEKQDEHFWAARAALTFNKGSHVDRGIFSIYFFNLLNLSPGEAIFQDAGLPHAYLEGQNIEIMANSDNVLRGGLTSKHVDVPELMKHIKFSETIPLVIYGQRVSDHEMAYPTPAEDFELSMIKLAEGDTLIAEARGTEIYFVTEGNTNVAEGAVNSFPCNRGDAFVAFDGGIFRVTANKEATLCKASVA